MTVEGGNFFLPIRQTSRNRAEHVGQVATQKAIPTMLSAIRWGAVVECGAFLYAAQGGFLTTCKCRNCGAVNSRDKECRPGETELPPNHVCSHASYSLDESRPAETPSPADARA